MADRYFPNMMPDFTSDSEAVNADDDKNMKVKE